jgi:hypothetical protein
MYKIIVCANHRMPAKNINKTSIKVRIEQGLKRLKRQLN